MSNYTKTTNFATKDNLSPGNPLKIVKGTEIDTEYNNIATAVATKTDNSAAAITGGTINGATVGATTPATGAFTTLAASGVTTLADALVGGVTQAAFNTVSTTLNLGGAATAVNIGAATGTATVANTTLAAKAITASTTLNVTGASTLTGAVTATAGVTGPITTSSATITGGTITGITDLAVADGGTGASTAANARTNLSAASSGANSDITSITGLTTALSVLQGGTGTATPNIVAGTNVTVTGTWPNQTIAAAGGGGSPGGSNTEVQYNNAGVFAGITGATSNGTALTLVAPVLGTPASATLTNATGLPLTTGVTGILPAANGGTGVANNAAMTVTGSGNFAYTRTLTGTTNVTFPTTGTLATLGGVETFTGTKTFSGSSSTLAEVLSNAAEVATVEATAATGTINYDITTQSVRYFTSNASANWTVNFRASSGTSLNTAMSTGQSVTVAFLVTQGSTAYYNSVVQVDGTTVTPKYQGGTAYASGNASAVDVYMYTIIKTGSAAFTVFTSQTKFA